MFPIGSANCFVSNLEKSRLNSFNSIVNSTSASSSGSTVHFCFSVLSSNPQFSISEHVLSCTPLTHSLQSPHCQSGEHTCAVRSAEVVLVELLVELLDVLD